MVDRLSRLPDLLPEGVRRAPGFSRTAPVTHAVAVGAYAREVVELGLTGAGDVKRSDVMHFDVALAQVTVSAGKIEAADLALERLPGALDLLDLEQAQLRVSLACKRPADQEPSFDRGCAVLVDFVRLPGKAMQFAGCDSFLKGLGGLEHLGLTLREGFDHEQRGLAASRGRADVQPVVRHEVSGLAADAARRPKAGKSEFVRAVDRERAEQLRQLLNLPVVGPQLPPTVLHNQRSGQYELVLGPRRYPHEQYRMSVRRNGGCVQRTAGRTANLVRSRCQWGLSPSVMVDCKMCLPLYGCKEGT